MVLSLDMEHRGLDEDRFLWDFPVAGERRQRVIKAVLKRALPQIVAMEAIAGTELQPAIGVDMERVHAASAGGRFYLITSAGGSL